MTKAEESGQKGPRAVEDCWSGFQRLNHDSLSHVSHVSHVYVYMSNRQRYIVILIQSCFACNLPHLVVQDHMYLFHMLDTGVFAGEPRVHPVGFA